MRIAQLKFLSECLSLVFPNMLGSQRVPTNIGPSQDFWVYEPQMTYACHRKILRDRRSNRSATDYHDLSLK